MLPTGGASQDVPVGQKDEQTELRVPLLGWLI